VSKSQHDFKPRFHPDPKLCGDHWPDSILLLPVKRRKTYEQSSATHRRDSTRRLRKKSAFLFSLLGWFAICIHPVFLVLALFSEFDQRRDNFKVAAAYVVAGLLLLGVAALFRPPPYAVRKMREHRRREKMDLKQARSRKRTDRQAEEQSGTVLILVLVVVALTAALILEAQVGASSHHRYAQAVMDHTRLRLAAADAVFHGIELLREDEDSEIDHLDEPWAFPTRESDPSGIELLIEIEDLNRYYDLNNVSLEARPSIRAPAAILAEILELCEVPNPRNRADALRDWIDTDGDGTWESEFYNSLAVPYAPADRLLYSWTELLYVDGFHREDFLADAPDSPGQSEPRKLIDALTIIPVSRNLPIRVNVNTANRTVLEGVLGRDQRAALEQILARREHRPILQEDVRQITLDPDLAQRLGAYVAVRSEYYRIRARAAQGDRSRIAEALVHRDTTGNIGILDWIQ